MHIVGELYERFKGLIHPSLAWDLLSLITRHHRIQGSRGLWSSVRELGEVLENAGLPVKINRVEPGAGKGFIKAPISWDPVEGFLELKINGKTLTRLDLQDHPTLLSAHTGSGEGCGEVRVCGEKPCSGEAVLVTGYLYHHYKHSDARLLVYYARNRDPNHVPYTGLFLEPGEIIGDKVVMNIPYKLAVEIISRKIQSPRTRIEACWRSRVEIHNEGLPILTTCYGKDPRILYISHICHPKPGAHDNASGSVVNALIALTASQLNSEGFCHAWIPEYTGTVFLDKIIPETIEAVINLDMVGSKQEVTGSVLALVNPPRLYSYKITPLLWIGLRKTFNKKKTFTGYTAPTIKYTPAPYGMGSDHDVFLSWGVEAVMLNEWPSRYYHTDGDRPETISPENLADTALASLISGELYYKLDGNKKEHVAKLYTEHMKTYYSLEALNKGYPLTRLTRNLLKKPVIREKPSEPILESPIVSRRIYELLGPEKYMEIRKINSSIDLLGLYMPLAVKLGIDKPIDRFDAEKLVGYRRRERKLLLSAWEEISGLIH